MDIIIDKDKVIKDVSMSVSIIARDLVDSNGGSLYDKVAIQQRDRDFLLIFFDKALSELSLALCDFVISREGDVLSLYLNDRTNTGLSQDVSNLCEDYLRNRVAYEWMKTKAADYSSSFLSQSEDSVRLIKEKLYYKNVPADNVMLHPKCSCIESKSVCITGKTVYRVFLYKDAITSDIDQELFGMYKRRKDSASTLMGNDIELHRQMSIYINKHTKRLCERLSAYLINLSCDYDSDNTLDRVPQYVYLLGLPNNWNCSHAEQLAEEMHTYVVNASLYDFLKTSYPDEALIFGGASDAAWANVKHTVSVRVGGIKKPIQPF